MKQLLILLAVIISSSSLTAQTNEMATAVATGYLITNSNEKLEGIVKEAFKKGSIDFTDAQGNTKNFTPSEISEFTIGPALYLAYLNDFYKVSTSGDKGILLQKATRNSNKIVYNGPEAYTLPTTEGKPGDYYLKIKSSGKVSLVTRKNFESVFAEFCADCTSLQTSIRGKQVSYDNITKAVDQYNSCN